MDSKRAAPNYVCRIKNNPVLDRMAEPHLRRPVGSPPSEPRTFYFETTYQAESWSRSRRAVLILQERPGELFLHRFWLIASFSSAEMHPEILCQHYRERGTAEGHMGELMHVLAPALSSSSPPKQHYRGLKPARRYASVDFFAVNEVLLLLNVLIYNLAHVVRTLLESATGQGWSLMGVRERILELPARLVLHARSATLVITQSAAHLWSLLLLKFGGLRCRSP